MKVYGNDSEFIVELPQNARSKEQILDLLKDYQQQLSCIDWNAGRMSGAVYLDYSNENHLQLMRDVFASTCYSNPLHAEVFPEIRKMESEITRIVLNLFNGTSQSVGTVTSGGTESIILACKAYRDCARFEKEIREPIILAPFTVHAAFDKAAQLLDCRSILN